MSALPAARGPAAARCRSHLATIGAILVLGGCQGPGASREPVDTFAYVGRDRCVECHEDENAAFLGSDHDRAMDVAADSTVLGDFSGAEARANGVTARFDRRDGRFFVTTDGPDGAQHRYEVRYTFGVRPLQQYLVAMDGGRLQRLPWSWDSRPREDGGGRWFHVYGDLPIGSSDLLHWTRPSQNWNRMCAECHSTRLEKNYDPGTASYRSTWAEIDVSCEACHGPASGHLAWAAKNEKKRRQNDRPHDDPRGFPTRLHDAAGGTWLRRPEAVTASRTAATTSTELNVCARCHAHRLPIHPFRYGDAFLDAYAPSVLRDPLYYPDGQVREEVYVYGSFLQSRMYAAGVLCTDCHEPHSTRLRAEGDDLCSRCHDPGRFATKRHHFHESSSAGARCVSCHMPETTFMQVDARRDHSFRIPNPAISGQIGSPDACTACHTDKTVRWAAEKMAAWYGRRRVERGREPFGPVFAAALQGAPSARDQLIRIAGQEKQSGIVRATALSLLRRFPGAASLAALQRGVSDDDPLVRREAAAAVDFLSPADRQPILAPLLRDSVRAVRLAAAHALAGAPRSHVSPEAKELLEKGLREYEESLRFMLDDPAANVRLGDFYATRGEAAKAEAAYLRAIDMEPAYVIAYVNLADYYESQHRDEAGRTILLRGLRRSPRNGALHFALGLACIRTDRRQEGIEHLASSVSLEPANPRFAHAYALALAEAGASDRARTILESALERNPYARDIGVALVALCRSSGRFDLAVRHAEQLRRAFPEDRELSLMAERLRAELRGRSRRPATPP